MKSLHRLDPDALTLTRDLVDAVRVRTAGQMSLRAVSEGSGVHHSSINRLARTRNGRPTLDTFVALARWAGLRVALVPVDLPGGRLAETVRRLTVENDNLRRRLAAHENATTRAGR